MPTVLKQGSIRYRIYPGDHNPPHVHVQRGKVEARVEIATGVVLTNTGFKQHDLSRIVGTVLAYRQHLADLWEVFNDD